MIIYTVICRAKDAAILVEVSSPELTGNAPQVTATLMTRLKEQPDLLPEGERKTFAQRNAAADEDFLSIFIESCAQAMGEEACVEEHFFHLLLKEGVIYCCIGDDADVRDQKVNFAFLDQICEEFMKRHRPSRINNANAYAFDKSFSPSVRSAMHHHNINHTSIAREEKVQKLVTKVEDLGRAVGIHINLLLERGEKLDKLVQKSDELEQDAKIFRKKTKLIRQRQRRKYAVKFVLLWCLITIICGVVMYVAVVSVCGTKLQFCKRAGRGSGSSSSSGNNLLL